MSVTIDKKIVEMAFENDRFEKNIGTSVDSLNRLKRSLDFKNHDRAFDSITDGAKRVNLSSISDGVSAISNRFSAMGIVGMGVLLNLTNSAIEAGKRIARALIIDPIKTGLNEYETKLNSVQTILANTAKEGTTLEVVTKALNDLNNYSDKTIYNFQEMARNIGTFTAAGVSLDTSVAAIKGIANLAAISGSNSQQASTAMYQLSQALSSGTIRLMDWNSVVSAGMGGQVFQDAIVETARVHGVAIDQILEQEGGFRNSLQTGWLSAEIMTETLKKFTGDLTEEQLRSMGYTEEQIAGIIKMGKTANDAATKVKTFSQLMQTLSEAAQSGWAQTWEIIIGDFEEAKAFLTELNNFFGAIIGASADARNQLLGGWSDLGGRTKLLESLQNVLNAIVGVINPIREGMREIFPPVTAENLFKITSALADFTKGLIIGGKTADEIKRIFKGIFAVLDIGKTAIFAIAKEFGRLLSYLAPVPGGLSEILAKFGDFLVRLRDTVKANQVFEKIMRTVGDTILLVSGVIATAVKAIIAGIERFKELEGTQGFLKAFIGGIGGFFEFFKNLDFGIIEGFIERLKARFAPLAQIGEFLKKAFAGGEKAVNPFAEKLQKIKENVKLALTKFVSGILDYFSKIDFSNFNFNNAFDSINAGLLGALLLSITQFVRKGSGLFGSIVDIFKGAAGFAENANGILAGITTVLTGVKDVLTAYQQQIRAGILLKIAGAVAILALSLIALSLVDSEKLTGALASITALFANLFGAMAIYEKTSSASGIPGMAKGIAAMIGLSVAVLILSGALVNLAQVPGDQILKGVVAITALTGVLIGMSSILSKSTGTVVRGAGSLILFAVALRALIGPIKTLGNMDTQAMTQGLVGLGVMLAEIGLFLKALNFSAGDMEDVLGLLILSGAISVLGGVIKQLGALPADTLAQGLSVLGIMLAGLSGFSKIATGGGMFMLTAAGMLILAGAMTIFADVLEQIGAMSWEQVSVALVGLGGGLAILAIALNAMNGAMMGAGALVIAAGALFILAPALKILGSMSLEQIGLALLAMAGAFTVLGLAASILTPLLPSLLLLGAAIAILGLATLAAGAGVLAFATGIASLAAVGAAGGAAIAAVLLGVAAAIPVLAAALAIGMINFAKIIEQGAPTIFSAAKTLMLGFIGTITETIPQVVDMMLTFVETLLTKVAEKMPAIIQAGYDILIGFLEGVRANLPTVIPLALEVIAAYINGIAQGLPAIIDSGWNLIISWIDGMTAAVDEHLPTLITSVQELGLAIIKGVIKGMLDARQNAVDAIKEIGTMIIDSFKELFGINSPSTVFIELATQIIAGLINGLRAGFENVRTTAVELANKLIDSVKDKYASMTEAGEDLVRGFAEGIREYIFDAVNAAEELATTVLTKIKKTLGINSPAKELITVGRHADEGMAIGILRFAHVVTRAIRGLGDDALSGFSSVVSEIAESVNADMNFSPTIRPVLDMTEIKGSKAKFAKYLKSDALGLDLSISRAQQINRFTGSSESASEPAPTDTASKVVSFVQNNYSPKELSRIDIYRQTKNQLLQLTS